jgi:hypothetical protein
MFRLLSRLRARRSRPGAEAGDPVDAFNLAIESERLGRDADAEHWYRWVAYRITYRVTDPALALGATPDANTGDQYRTHQQLTDKLRRHRG